jgi:hypothetical protein
MTYSSKDAHAEPATTAKADVAGAPYEEEAIPPISLPPEMIEAGLTAYFTGPYMPELPHRMVEAVYLAMHAKRPMEDGRCRATDSSCLSDESKGQGDR